MSIKSKLLWLGIGGGLIAVFVKESRRRVPRSPAEVIPADPEIEAALDLASLDLEEEAALDVPEVVSLDALDWSAHDRSPPDDDEAMESGQNWLEALETEAIEDVSDLETPLTITDDVDVVHSALDMSSTDDDIPVADRGAGGPAGL